MLGLRGGAEIRSEADLDAEREAALTGLPANLDDASSDEIPAWIVYDKRRKSAAPQYERPRLAQPDSVAWVRRRAISQPTLHSELIRTPLHATRVNTSNTSTSEGLMISPRRPSPGHPSPVNAGLVEEWLDRQPAETQSTSPPPVPADVASVPSPEPEGEELTPDEIDMLNDKFQGTLRGGGGSCDQPLRIRYSSDLSRILRRAQKWLGKFQRRLRGETPPMRILSPPQCVAYEDGMIHARSADPEHGQTVHQTVQHRYYIKPSFYQMPLASHSIVWTAPKPWSACLQPRPSLVQTIVPSITLTPPTPHRRANQIRPAGH